MLELIQSLDSAALLFIQEVLRLDWLDPTLTFYTNLGNAGMLWIVLSLLLLCHPRTRKAGFFALLSMLLGLLLCNMTLKHLVARPRPWVVVEGLRPLLDAPDPHSFPSGHTCAAFAFAGSLCFWLKGRGGKVLALGAAAVMGLSRLYVGVHFPTDVLGGMCVGLLCSGMVRGAALHLRPERKK